MEKRRLFDVVPDWFSLIIVVVSLIFGAGSFYGMVRLQEPRICKLEEKAEKIDVMSNDIAWIKDYMQRKLK